MARKTTTRGLPLYETALDPPDGASQQGDLAAALDARIVTGEQAATLPEVPPARRLQWHSGTQTLWYSDGTAWRPVQYAARRTITTARNLALTDTGSVLDVNSPDPVTLTIPPQSSVAWLDGTTITPIQIGAGAVTIAPGTGVTIRADGDRRTSARRYAPLSLQRIGPDEWVLADLGGNAAAARLGEVANFAIAPGLEWALADGRAVTAALGWPGLRAGLISAGSPYGISGSDPLLPDLRGTTVIGTGQRAGLSSRAAGDRVGAESVVLDTTQIPAHDHPTNDPGHGHNAPNGQGFVNPDNAGNLGTGNGFTPRQPGSAQATAASPTGITVGSRGGGLGHPNMQPSLAIPTYIRVLP